MRRILVTGDFEIKHELVSEGVEIVHIRIPTSEAQILEVLKDSWGYVVGGPEYVSKELMDAAPLLKELVVLGTGTTSFVDLPYARKRGINVSNTPAINADVVAEFTVAMIINALSGLFESIAGVQFGTSWQQRPRLSIRHAKVGIVGLGNIGGALTKKLSDLGAKNLYYYSRSEKKSQTNAEYLPLQQLLQTVDIVCLHVTYNESTHHLLNTLMLSTANPALKILNLSHPRIICPETLKFFLGEFEQSFCFLDGYYDEWINNKGSDLDPYGLLSLGAAKFVASSHIAAQETTAIQRMLDQAFYTLNAGV